MAQPGSLPWFLLNLESAILNPASTGEDIYDFVLSNKRLGFMSTGDFVTLTSSKEVVAATLQKVYTDVFGPDNTHLKNILADPARLEKLLDEYIEIAAEDRANAAAAAAKPN